MLRILGARSRAVSIAGAGLAALLTFAGGGCAKSPESIAPAYVSTVNYQSWSCNQLAEEGRRLTQALAEASTQQRNARTNDTIGVIFLGIPVSSLSGDNIAPQIANLKGQMVAVQQAGNFKNCGFRVETASVEQRRSD